MSVTEVLVILLLHWFADFVLQTDWEAKNKSTNNKALTMHVLKYAAVWFIASNIYCVFTNNWLMMMFPVITFMFHWITDYFTSRVNTSLHKAGKIHEFFVSIGFDQWLHYFQLFMAYSLLK